jgi:hypothetical protein
MLEDRRFWAEGIIHEYDAIHEQLGTRQDKVEAVQKIDARVDMAAVLAEISFIIGDRVLLRRLEFISEPIASTENTANRSGSAVRSAGLSRQSAKTVSLGRVRFRVALAGVAANSAEVGALVCRLDDSPYFQQVHPLYRENTIQVGATDLQTPAPPERGAARKDQRSLSVTEFEITCYLANYEEHEKG